MYGDYFKDADIANFAEQCDLQIADEIFSPARNINRLVELDKFLQEVKVDDLAVGSGAFPLGMLNEITKAREVLTVYLNLGRDEKIVRRLYDLKLETIKNSIFACDIEPSAVDIAKLRLWLTLVIDDEPTADKDSFKPKPLPNLDCNIICGNSLIDEFEGFPLIKHSKILNNMTEAKGQGVLLQGEIDIRIAELIRLQKNLFHESDHDRKEECRRYIRDIYDGIIVNQLVQDSALTKRYKLAAQKNHCRSFSGNSTSRWSSETTAALILSSATLLMVRKFLRQIKRSSRKNFSVQKLSPASKKARPILSRYSSRKVLTCATKAASSI